MILLPPPNEKYLLLDGKPFRRKDIIRKEKHQQSTPYDRRVTTDQEHGFPDWEAVNLTDSVGEQASCLDCVRLHCLY